MPCPPGRRRWQWLLALALLAQAPAFAFSKMTFAADAFFSRQSAVLDDKGKAGMRLLVDRTASGNTELILAVGHAESGEADAEGLSQRRAKAAKWYLMQLGVAPWLIYTEGMGARVPVQAGEASARDRRVELEFVGMRHPSRTEGFRRIMVWWTTLPGPQPKVQDEWTGLTPLDMLPHVERELRPRFLHMLKLALIHLQDDEALRQLLALPYHDVPDVPDLPAPALCAQAIGTPYARSAFGPAVENAGPAVCAR